MKTYVVEHKTSSEDIGLGSIYWRKLTLDPQISNYIRGVRSLGYEPDGVLYDVLRKPGFEPYAATPMESRKYTKPTKAEPTPRLYANQRDRDETPEEYRDRCLADISERPDYYYQRGVVVRLESEESEAAFDLWQTAEQIRASRNAERWPRNQDSCVQYHRMCDYWEVCSGETSIDDAALYQRGELHPELDGKHHLPLITSSSARSYRACAKRYYFAYELGARARKAAASLSFGKLIHAALEAWLLGGCDLDAAIAATATRALDFELAKAQAMLMGYHARWSGEPLDVVAVEKEFVCDLVNPETGGKSRTFALGGKVDAIATKQDV